MDMNVLIEQVRQLKPNSYSEEMLKSWALELEARVQQEVYQDYDMPEREAAGLETDGYWVEDGVADEHWHETVEKVMERLYSEARLLSGEVSGEHGIGHAKRAFLEESLGREQVKLMRGIKHVFDPNGILNPGKVI